MLDRLGYTVLTATSPGDAIRLARANAGRIDLLVTDVVMPEMNGRDLAKQLMAAPYPNLKILFMSGYTANVIAHHGLLDTGVHFANPLPKKILPARCARPWKGCDFFENNSNYLKGSHLMVCFS
jgi:CheY-like chemotaxis protein